jgi:hypothetical protein
MSLIKCAEVPVSAPVLPAIETLFTQLGGITLVFSTAVFAQGDADYQKWMKTAGGNPAGVGSAAGRVEWLGPLK